MSTRTDVTEDLSPIEKIDDLVISDILFNPLLKDFNNYLNKLFYFIKKKYNILNNVHNHDYMIYEDGTMVLINDNIVDENEIEKIKEYFIELGKKLKEIKGKPKKINGMSVEEDIISITNNIIDIINYFLIPEIFNSNESISTGGKSKKRFKKRITKKTKNKKNYNNKDIQQWTTKVNMK
jgi:hypothetical protein